MSLSAPSRVRATTLCDAVMDEGVRTFVIVKTTCSCCFNLSPCTVNVSLRSAATYVTDVPEFVVGEVKATAGAFAVSLAFVPDVATPELSVNSHVDCCAPSPATLSGSTSSTLPPTSTRPAVANVTVATEKKPGVSVAVSNAAGVFAVSTPASILSVVIAAVVSMFLLRLSCVVIVTVFATTFDDGVSTFVIVNTCSVACAIPLVPHVNFSSRLAAVYVIEPGAGAPMFGVVYAMLGGLLASAEM